MDWLVAFLTWLSADPHVMDRVSPRAAAAVDVAYATMAKEKVNGGKQATPAGKGNCPNGKCPPPAGRP